MLAALAACVNKPSKKQNQSVQSLGIIPEPVSVKLLNDSLVIDKNILVIKNEKFALADKMIEDILDKSLTERDMGDQDSTKQVTIKYIVDSSLNDEGYKIDISSKEIILSAKTDRGAFYAAQTLRQMIWQSTHGLEKSSFKLREVKIYDTPKYAWRGFHIDVSRHFFSKEYLMRLIDWLSYYKINKLQIHLTDDQGWRIEIDHYPLLTKIGAWRTLNNWDSLCMKKAKTDSLYTIDSRYIKVVNGKEVYGGFYTKQDIKDIIRYAHEHYIDIIPEIDMPGHMSAAIRAYPFLSATNSAGWGKEFSYPICPCKNSAMEFSHTVWDEIASLFPSNVVHIGGDEVNKKNWENSSVCKNFMKKNHLDSISQIQSYFEKNIGNYLESKGKTVIAWDDVLEGKVDSSLIIMYWRDWVKDAPQKAAENGNRIILTPWTLFYLSMDDTADTLLQALYKYNPDSIYSPSIDKKVIGMQGCVWTEEIPSEAMFEYHVFPRLEALSEVEWGSKRNWSSFKIRLESHLKYLASKHIVYQKPIWVN
ncbi:MAG: beta-N-acetylhexosaminidase [Bacteroidales bacterium]|nr:beta-N-acetylhexosaminidase [Bacteroidales bacterium]